MSPRDPNDKQTRAHSNSPNTIQTTQQTTPDVTASSEDSTLCQFSKMLDIKLDKMKHDIITQITSKLQSEVNTALTKIKLEITKDIETLHSDQTTILEKLNNLHKRIEQLEKEKAKLEQQIKNIENQNAPKHEVTTDNSKKIVLFGLTCQYRVDERDLYNQVISLFYDILNVNLEGYIEDLYFVGNSRHRKRPLVIEIISKRMTKYILQHATFFKNSGFGISEFLTKQALTKKRPTIKISPT